MKKAKNPLAWAMRRTSRRLVLRVKAVRAKRKTTTKKRRATNRRQPWCPACQLFVKRFCITLPEPCGVCPTCCPGHPKKEEAPR